MLYQLVFSVLTLDLPNYSLIISSHTITLYFLFLFKSLEYIDQKFHEKNIIPNHVLLQS